MNLLKKYPVGYGKSNIVALKEGGLKLSAFDIVKLESGQSINDNTGSFESAFVILSGTCSISGDKFDYPNIGKRKDVFSGKPTSIYLPCRTSYKITAVTEVEIAVCSAESTLNTNPQLIAPDSVREVNLGVLNWSRKAYFIIDQDFNSGYLFLGETFIPAGRWAFPPHRHDNDNLPIEVDMEEIYHFRINPQTGFGIQLSYTDDKSRDDAYLVRNGDTVMLPDGYHPVAASPVDSVYFLWFMAGDKRYFLSKPDEEYKWVVRCENLLKTI